ncbi:hypothetical protein [Vibrio vulnificus]|uniref:hypothetical protein n=1 Tax=Vibrio vulnificus TaxID=672 RepID=UPI0019D430C5|nr:hypothetical protein [Vibrio vulnificus]MBN8085908.1 hypothetical protein [Vibrio vulnificus]MBN8128936.1 hypothetical protein [Vibrio vulnificus]HAS6258254.1 hypothetical protein [Vibrio vulnificus]HDY8076665.1 hypothetical protein [Vibrio vulnificus]
MATTIQVVEDLTVGKFIDIEGKRCEVEAFSFSQALTEKMAQDEIFQVMKNYLIEEKIITDKNGQLYWCDSDESLLPEEDYED